MNTKYMKWSTAFNLFMMAFACMSCMFISGIPVISRLPVKDEAPAFATSAPISLDRFGEVLIKDPMVTGAPIYLFTRGQGTRVV